MNQFEMEGDREEEHDVQKTTRPIDEYGRVLSDEEIEITKKEQEGTGDFWREQK